MTNVPPEVREIWTDLYKLFDRYYLMKNDEASWQSFWEDASAIRIKSGKNDAVTRGCILIADYIGERFKRDSGFKNADNSGGSDEST